MCCDFFFLGKRRLYELWCVSLGHLLDTGSLCGLLMFVPFSGAWSKGIGFDGTRWYLTLSGGSGREKGWKE